MFEKKTYDTTDIGLYCAKSLVLGNVRAYHAYANSVKPSQNGVCDITFSVNWFESLIDSEEDQLAAPTFRLD